MRQQQQQRWLSHLILLLLLLLCVPLFQEPGAAAAGTSPSSPAAKAPAAPAAPAEPVNVPAVMAKKGCATFSGLLTSTADAAQTYASIVDAGLTAFCPVDSVMKPFLPKFKNLTADGKLSLLLYHAIPVYYSIPMLKTGNGVVNTLATDGVAKNYNLTVQNEGDQVTLKTRLTVATITATIYDKEPCAVYAVDEVLQPAELFKPAEPPAPAPAPETTKAAAPKGAKSKKAKHAPAPAGPEEQPADQKADDNAAGPWSGFRPSVATLVALVTVAFTYLV